MDAEPVADASIAAMDAAPAPPLTRLSLSVFERLNLPPPKNAGKAPPAQPQHCCSTNPSCGARSCPPVGLDMSGTPRLTTRGHAGLKAKSSVDEQTRARVEGWIQRVGAYVGLA